MSITDMVEMKVGGERRVILDLRFAEWDADAEAGKGGGVLVPILAVLAAAVAVALTRLSEFK